MRETLRGCLVWFVGYPLSVLAASAVLVSAVWLPGSWQSLSLAVKMFAAVAPIVAAFAILPAILTKPSPNLWPYVASGIRAGAWCGLLAVSLFVIVLVAEAVRQIHRWFTVGESAPEAPEMLFGYAFGLATAMALFTVAGAVGGLVFGLFAAGANRVPK
jgi:hypothetical protein